MNAIFTVIRKFFSSIKNFIVFIGISIAKAIKYIALFIYKPVKFIALTIFKPIKISGIFIWKYFLKYIYLFFKYASIYLYKFIDLTLFNLIRLITPFIKKFFIFLGKIFVKIFNFFSFIGVFLSEVLIKFINILIDFTIKVFKGIKKGIFESILFIRLFFRKLPNRLFLIIINSYIYISLLIIFIVYEIPKFILMTVLYNGLKYFIIGLESVLNFFLKLSENIFKPIIKFTKYIARKLYNPISYLSSYLYDFFGNFYIIVFSPIILIILIILFIPAIIHNLLIYLVILFKTIFNKDCYKEDLVTFKPNYNPSINLFTNVINEYKRKNEIFERSSDLKNIYLISEIIIWNSLFILIINIIFMIILLPLTIITLVINLLFNNKLNEKSIIKRIRLKDSIDGTFKQKKLSFKNDKIQIRFKDDLTYSNEFEAYITSKDLNKLYIEVRYDNKIIHKDYVNILYSNISYMKYLIEINALKIKENKTSIFVVPDYEDNNFKVTTEILRLKDKLDNNNYYLRNNANKTTIKLVVSELNTNNKLERNIKLNNLYNRTIVTKLNLNYNVFKLKQNESFLKYLDPRYEYEFKETKFVSSNGNINASDDEEIIVTFNVKGFSEEFNAYCYIKNSNKNLKILKKQITKPVIDINNKELLITNEISVDGYSRRVTWDNYSNIEQEITYDSLYGYYGNSKYIELNSSFVFNNKTYNKLFKIINPGYNKKNHFDFNLVALSKLEYIKINDNTDINFYGKNKFLKKNFLIKRKYISYIKFPLLGHRYVKYIKWISLEPKLISSSGKYKNYLDKEVKFKLVMYHNLFIRKTYIVTVDVNSIKY